jgi:branched-chain amino acid transport system permease protein
MSVLITLAIVHHLLPLYYRELLTEVLIFGLFALGFDIIFGFAGLLNFGMAVFFGIGGYITLLSCVHLSDNIWLALFLTIVGSGLFSFLWGISIARFKSHYFVGFTLVVSMILFFVAMSQRPITGADEGLTFTVPEINFGFVSLSLYDMSVKFYFVLIICLLVWSYVWRFFNTPYGRAVISVRENEDRAKMLGYNTFQVKVAAFTLSGTVASLAGALYVLHLGFNSAHSFYWLWTARAVWWTIIGGAGTLIGAFVGPGALVFLEDFVSSWNPDAYMIIMGLLMIIVIMLAPQGIVGTMKKVLGLRGK